MRVRWNGGEILSPGMWSMGIKNTYYCSVRMLKSYAGRVQRNCRHEMVGLSSIFVARRLGQHIVGLGRRQLIIVCLRAVREFVGWQGVLLFRLETLCFVRT